MIEERRARLELLVKAAHRIRALRAEHKAYGYIAEALNREGIPAYKGGVWRRGTVHALCVAEGIA